MFHKIAMSCENSAWLSNLAISIFHFWLKKESQRQTFHAYKELAWEIVNTNWFFTIHFMFVLESKTSIESTYLFIYQFVKISKL